MHRSLEILRELLMPDLLGEIVSDNGSRFALLREQSPDAKLKRVDIQGVPAGSLLIKLDSYEPPVSLFKGDRGQRKRCDYVLFTVFGGQGYVLFIELKSATLKRTQYIAQFKGAECAIDYCHAVLKRFYGHDQLVSSFSRRFVVFYKPRIAKRPTRPKTAPGNISPEKAMLYPSVGNPPLHALLALSSS
jgi:hypothetical protein